MAYGATMIFEIESGGNNANGGFFDPGQNAGMATDGAATLATTSAPVFTSASYNFVSGDVGAWLFIYSGTNWIPGWYKIASVASNAATLTATVGSTVAFNSSQMPTLGTATGCATTASPTGATWSVDYSQQAAAQVAYTDIVIDATTNTKATSSAHPFTVAMVGNALNFTSGTGFTTGSNINSGRRIITACVSGVITCEVAIGMTSSTGGHASLGGAFADFTNLMWAVNSNMLLVSMICYVKAATYTQTAVYEYWSPCPAFVGYSTTRCDGGQPTITTATNSIDLFQFAIFNLPLVYWQNFIFTNTASTRADAFNFSGSITVSLAIFQNCLFNGMKSAYECSANFPNTGRLLFRNCTIENSTGYGVNWGFNGSTFSQLELDGSVIKGGSSGGIFMNSGQFHTLIVSHSIIYNNTTHGIWLDDDSNPYIDSGLKLYNSAVVGNGGDGLRFGSTGGTFAKCFQSYNSIYTQNGGWGWNFEANPTVLGHILIGYGNAFYGNTSGARTNVGAMPGEITLTGDPFTSKSTGDWTLNSTSGAGQACKGQGWPTVIPS